MTKYQACNNKFKGSLWRTDSLMKETARCKIKFTLTINNSEDTEKKKEMQKMH